MKFDEIAIIKLCVILLIAGIVYLSCVGVFLFITIFTPNPGFYFMMLTALYWSLVILISLKLLGARRSAVGFILIALPLAIALGGYGYVYYQNNLPRVADGGLLLGDYAPFTSPRIATLERPASLRLEGELPRLYAATALYTVAAAFVQATCPEGDYAPKTSSILAGGGSDIAYERLISGQADILFTAGPSERQLADATARGVELVLTPIGREAFVFFVNPANPVDGLTLEQIRGIYSGRITGWSEVGGRWMTIQAFQRNPGSGSQTMLERIMGGTPLMSPPYEKEVVGMMGGMLDEVMDYRNASNALGFSFLYFVTQMHADVELKLLAVDGVYPSPATIADGAYPLVGDFYMVTAGPPAGNAAQLIEWAQSAEGRELIAKTGYVPWPSEPVKE